MSVDNTIHARKIYGEYPMVASLSQTLKEEMSCRATWNNLDADMKESLEMIQAKISRIINGDPTYLDNWHDIQGYAKLIETRLKDDIRNAHEN